MKPVQHLFCFYHTTEICSTPAFCGEFGCANNSHKKKKRDQVHHSKQKERCGCNSGCLKATDNLPDYNFCVVNVPKAHTLCANKPIPRHESTIESLEEREKNTEWVAYYYGRTPLWYFFMEPIEGSL